MVRRLVVCCDGTWNRLSHKDGKVFSPTNVAKMAASVAAAGNGMEQPVFYDPGVGTGNILDRWTGGAFGAGLSDNIQDAYQFLLHNYEPGDQIFLFGFSRGAYTVRSLAGLIRKCGILRKRYSHRIVDAYDVYRIREGGADTDRAKDLRKEFSHHPVPIKFIGVWDTVGALGVPGTLFRVTLGRKYQFHDHDLSSSVESAYHALAIDEKRRAFAPTFFHQTDRGRAKDQTLEQVWFPGVHSDVGGGYARPELSNEAFYWIKAKAEEAGLAFDEPCHVPPGDPVGPMHESWTSIYKAIPKRWRPIGREPDANEKISLTAIARWLKDAAFRPPNLVSFYDDHPPPPS
jgi:uncharacterized protein (DUF2235 family)